MLPAAVWAAEPYRFAVVGDSRGGDNGINATIVAEQVTALIGEDVDLVISTGDLVNSGTLAQLQNWITSFKEPLEAAGIAVYPCRGNHDGSLSTWNEAFSGSHALPNNGPVFEKGVTYAVVHKNALFLSLDGNAVLPRVDQFWIDDQFQENEQPHVFTYCHFPAFSVDHLDCLGTLGLPRDLFWDSLGRAGSVAYFAGHDHFYNHARAQDSDGRWLHQYIVGCGGAPLYDWNGVYDLAPGVELIAHEKNYGYLVVEIDELDVTLTFKERVEPGVYAATEDIFQYTCIPMRAEGDSWWEIVVHVGGVLLALLFLIFRFVLV